MGDSFPASFHQVADAIAYLKAHFQDQPSLSETAAAVHLSPFHFHRLFSEWAGTTPKRFLEYLTLQYARQCLKEGNQSVMNTALDAGLSGANRLHDLFVSLEGMTPAAWRDGGANLTIRHQVMDTPFGLAFVATTDRGICHLSFIDDERAATASLQIDFPNARLVTATDSHQEQLSRFFAQDWNHLPQIRLHLKASPFQLRVWAALLRIPSGRLASYGDLAKQLGMPKAARAIGSAIGSNPVAWLIPCHRVIQASGALGGYRWGVTRKEAMIGWEAARREKAV